jgi:hypothetical protein
MDRFAEVLVAAACLIALGITGLLMLGGTLAVWKYVLW